MAEKPNPIVFIHGLWLHASSWGPWQELFRRHGYRTMAPGWPGEQKTVAAARGNPGTVANVGIEDITVELTSIIEQLPACPILIGHSFGGMIAEKLLGEDWAAAAIAIDAAQIKGVLRTALSAIKATFPVFKNPENKHRAVGLTAEQFRYSFANTLSEQESNDLYERWAISSPGRPLFEAGLAAFTPHSPDAVDTHKADRGPLLLIMGGRDHTVPEAITKSTFKRYRHSTAVTDLVEFADRGHSLTIDSGWHEVADACLTWLDKQGL